MENIYSIFGSEAAKALVVTIATAVAAEPVIVAAVAGGLLVAMGVVLGAVITSRGENGPVFDI